MSNGSYHNIWTNMQGKNGNVPEKEVKQQTSKWGICHSSSVMLVWLSPLAAKINKIKGMCTGSGCDGVNFMGQIS